jgi:hypothetical protein
VRPLFLLGSCSSHASVLGTALLQSTRCGTVTSIQPLHAIPVDSIIMSACRYATEGGLLESAIMGGLRGVDAHLLPNQRAARMRLFAPGGHLAKVGTRRRISLTAELCHSYSLHHCIQKRKMASRDTAAQFIICQVARSCR